MGLGVAHQLVPSGVSFVGPAAAGGGGGGPALTGLLGWYDADDATTFTLTGALVEQWRDKSGANNHINTFDAASRPSRAGTQNGKLTVAFGVGHFLKATPATPIAAAFPTTGMTIVYVFTKTGASQTYESLPFVLTEGSIGRPMEGWNVTRNWTVASIPAGTGSLWNMAATCPWRVFAVSMKQGVIYEEYTNGAQTFTGGTGSCTGNNTNQSLCMGQRGDRGTQFVGSIAEVLVYDRQLTAPERQQTEAYLKAKWGTP